jgi:hypothetical protein
MHLPEPPRAWGYGKVEIGGIGIGGSSSSSTQRNLFSFNLNDLIKGKGKRTEQTEGLEEIIGDNENYLNSLPSWAQRSKLPVPKYDQPASIDGSTETASTNNNEEKTTRSSFSLSSLINVEALLLASGETALYNETDTGTNLLKDMMRQSERQEDESQDSSTTSTSIIDAYNKLDTDTNSLASTTNMKTVNINNAEDQLSWNVLMTSVQRNIKDLVESPTTFSPSFEFSMAAELALKEATQSVEVFMNDAAASVSPDKVQNLIASASRSLAVDQSADVFKSTMDKVVMAAETLARDQGVDVSDAAAQARATTKYTAEFLRVANGVLVSGYVGGSTVADENKDLAKQLSIPPTDDVAKPLFNDFSSVESIADDEFRSTIEKGSEMALLSGAIYEDVIPKANELGYSVVANGTAADVVWLVTDNIGYDSDFNQVDESTGSDVESPMLVRTITFRGFDASDENVDREKLLYRICDAAPVPFGDGTKNLKVHRGLLEVALEAYEQIIQYIDMSGPNNKVVLNGHSIGGAVAALVLFLLTEERGADFVNEKILRVFTYGSPPVVTFDESTLSDDLETCSILNVLNLRSDIVYGYVQPWDPIVRMFSRIDPLYPLIGDLGEDGVSLYSSGPPRTLRPITRAILESWENWPTFRDDYKGGMNQEYMSVGVQHLLMPDSGRYLTDRLVSVNVAAFPIDDVLRVSTKELYSALETAFPLDTFTISLVPTAIRSFIHHFYPAYTNFAEYTDKEKRNIEDNDD